MKKRRVREKRREIVRVREQMREIVMELMRMMLERE